MAKKSSHSNTGGGKVTPMKSPQAGVNVGTETKKTLGILTIESPKNAWKPNGGGRK